MNNVQKRAAEEREALQKRLPENCHAIVIIVEELNRNKRRIGYSATTNPPDVISVLNIISTNLQEGSPF